MTDGIEVGVPPSGTTCQDCDSADPPGWWVHLRRCATCGHVGCCDTSPAQHATAHARTSGHAVVQSFEPGEDWFYDYESGEAFRGPALAPPESRPEDADSPAPATGCPTTGGRTSTGDRPPRPLCGSRGRTMLAG